MAAFCKHMVMLPGHCAKCQAERRSGEIESREKQRKVALESFNIVHGPGDGGSEHEFNCQNSAVQEGWLKLASAIIGRELVSQ